MLCLTFKKTLLSTNDFSQARRSTVLHLSIVEIRKSSYKMRNFDPSQKPIKLRTFLNPT